VNLYFACFKTGLIAVPVNNRLKAPEIAYILLWACDSVHHLSGQNLAKGRSSRGVLSGEKAHR